MARKTARRMELRKQAEAAAKGGSANGKSAKKKKKAPRKKSTSRSKVKVPERKRLVWVVYNGSMKEEARFPFDERDAAEKKIEQLQVKSPKKLFFIQRMKEPIPEAAPAAEASE